MLRRRDDQRCEVGVATFDAIKQGVSHSRLPEPLDVRGDPGGRLVRVQVSELTGNVVSQSHFGGRSGHRLPASSGAADATAASCAARALATPTSTAVTLYSGQLVAQSEFSVVTTFAPVTGWWNVV